MNINIHIDRLVLDGLPGSAHDLPAFQAAIQAEITDLLAAHGIAPQFLTTAAVPYVAAPAIRLTAHPTAHQLGIDIGRAAYSVFGMIDAVTTGGPSHG